MSGAATEIFAFLEHTSERQLLRIAFHSDVLRALVGESLSLIRICRNDGAAEANEWPALLDALRVLLTQPVAFEHSGVRDALEVHGSLDDVRVRWGDDASTIWRRAHHAATALVEVGSPLRVDLLSLLDELHDDGQSHMRIYAHRSLSDDLELVDKVGRLGNRGGFLFSVADLRDSRPFDVLIKVGPLRVRGWGGWGGVPDAVITAPRSSRIIQFTWATVQDDDAFPRDLLSIEAPKWRLIRLGEEILRTSSGLSWRRTTEERGTDGIGLPPLQSPDLASLGNVGSPNDDLHDAVLLVLPGRCGVLLPRGGSYLSVDSNRPPGTRVSARSSDADAEPGLYWLRQAVSAPDVGKLSGKVGPFAHRWKRRLADLVRESPRKLESALRSQGIRIVSLRHRIDDWCSYDGSVVHAPKRLVDFRALLTVLQPWNDSVPHNALSPAQWCSAAWDEVSQSRSGAISHGVLLHELITDELISILEQHPLLPQLSDNAHWPQRVSMPALSALVGYVDIFPIMACEDDYRCPESWQGRIIGLNEAMQWQE